MNNKVPKPTHFHAFNSVLIISYSYFLFTIPNIFLLKYDSLSLHLLILDITVNGLARFTSCMDSPVFHVNRGHFALEKSILCNHQNRPAAFKHSER